MSDGNQMQQYICFSNTIAAHYSKSRIISKQANYKEMKLESPLGSDLARLVRIWRALIDHRLKPLELTQTHWVTLHNIHQLPPDQSQIQLAKAIGIEQPSLVRTLDQLEEKGLISRQTCASDRRAKRIKLTEKAEPLISEMEAVINKTRAEILHGISAEELEQLITLIAKLEHNIIELQAKG